MGILIDMLLKLETLRNLELILTLLKIFL